MKKLYIVTIVLSAFFVIPTICNAETSPFKPDWHIGDSWKMEFTERSTDEFEAAAEFIGGPKYGNFFEPSTYIFTITEKKEIKGEECFEVEVYEQGVDKESFLMRLYYSTDTLKIKMVEEGGRIRIPHYIHEKDGPVITPYSSIRLPLSWPDFTQLDPADSPQVFPWGNSKIQQIVEIKEDTLKITWRLFYNEADDTWGSFITQEWRRGDPWWYKYEIGDENIITRKARAIFGSDIEPPAVSLTVTPDMLWPANHKMVEITPHITVSDNLDESPRVSLKSVTSNEPDDAPGSGDGRTTGDIKTTEDGRIYLRAERDARGNGRIYTITYSATDASANTSTASAIVTVPHDKGKKK